MKYTVVELFAGVGGFRIGLEGYGGKNANSNFKKTKNKQFNFIYANQWEPNSKRQHAYEIYAAHFINGKHSNIDISKVPSIDIPTCDVLCGGFPCQDYSVATTLKNSGGLEGKKGVLWWEIERIIKFQSPFNRPKILFFENVDRLIISPSKQKGRDFAILLRSLVDLGYTVEWKVINSADFGFPQKRIRTYIIGYRNDLLDKKKLENNINQSYEEISILNKSFPTENTFANSFRLDEKNLAEISEQFNLNNRFIKEFKNNPFLKNGIILNSHVYTFNGKSIFNGEKKKLKDIILNIEDVTEDLFINNEDLQKWIYLKGSKKIPKINKQGFSYVFAEGKISFPDDLNKPSRTIITGEGGKTPSRTKHVILQNNNFRRLSPIELERLNGFPDNYTKGENITENKRGFFMGNALVVPIIEKVGDEIYNFLKCRNNEIKDK